MLAERRRRSRAAALAPARRFGRNRLRGRSRKLAISRINTSGDVHFFKRHFEQAYLVGSAVYNPWLAGVVFQIAQIPNVSEFSNLFDRYMITHIKLKWYLTIDPSAQTAATASYPRLFWVPDYDDSTTPASINEIREHARCRDAVLHPNRPIIMNIKPAVLQEVYRGAVTTTYAPKWRTWLDMAVTDCPHYGLKAAIDDFTNLNYKLRIEGVMYFRCKDTR